MKRALVTFAFALAAVLGGSSSASADCLVNAGTCDGGECAVNTEDCRGWCTVNAGTCEKDASCAVNAGTCSSGSTTQWTLAAG